MKACTLFTSDNEVAEDWLGKFDSREPLDIYGQKYLIDEISTDYEPGFAGVTIKMYPAYQAKSPERPKKQEAWDGVGLPPVGVICEHEPYEMRNDPHKVEIIAHKKASLDVAVFWDEERQIVSYSSYHSFRPIKTAEQLAEEELEDAANKMFQRFGGIGGLTKKQCIWVVSEGYRKQ